MVLYSKNMHNKKKEKKKMDLQLKEQFTQKQKWSPLPCQWRVEWGYIVHNVCVYIYIYIYIYKQTKKK